MFPKGPNFQKLELPSNLNPEVMKVMINKEYRVFIIKAVIALIALIFGIIFIWKGVISESTIKFSYNDAKLEINNAWPGIVLSFISLILMLFSRLNVKITSKK
jgi:hypothetical protein